MSTDAKPESKLSPIYYAMKNAGKLPTHGKTQQNDAWHTFVSKALRALPTSTKPDGIDKSRLLDGFNNPQQGLIGWLALAEKCFTQKPRLASDVPPLHAFPGEDFLQLLLNLIERHADLAGRKQRKDPGWIWDALKGMIRKHGRLLKQCKPDKAIERFGKALIRQSIPDEIANLPLISVNTSGQICLSPNDEKTVKQALAGKHVSGADMTLMRSLTTKDFNPPDLEPGLATSERRRKWRQFVAEAAALDLRVQKLRWRLLVNLDNVWALESWIRALGNKSLSGELNNRRSWAWLLPASDHEKIIRRSHEREKKRRQRKKYLRQTGTDET
ncbi:MAG: hypothetical protein K8R87_01085 [Verrucomicrobia bacterium]|nr:hypothetical protein [Verrucomicrobiota bacterium]